MPLLDSGSILARASTTAAWTDAPPLQVANAKEKVVAPDGSPLDWFYDRRSQFIHSRLVPKGVWDGVPVFNIRLFEDKSTNWNSKYVTEALVEDEYPNLWKDFLGRVGEVWETLLSRLRSRDRVDVKIQKVEIPYIDLKSLKPGDIQISPGPVPPSSILWNFGDYPGPSGSR